MLKQKPGSLDFFKFHPYTRYLHKDGLLDPSLQKMLLQMLCADPSDRIKDLSELKKNEFLTGVNEPENTLTIE